MFNLRLFGACGKRCMLKTSTKEIWIKKNKKNTTCYLTTKYIQLIPNVVTQGCSFRAIGAAHHSFVKTFKTTLRMKNTCFPMKFCFKILFIPLYNYLLCDDVFSDLTRPSQIDYKDSLEPCLQWMSEADSSRILTSLDHHSDMLSESHDIHRLVKLL